MLAGDTSGGGEPELGLVADSNYGHGTASRPVQAGYATIPAAAWTAWRPAAATSLPLEHPDGGQRGSELLNPPQGGSASHSQASLDPAMALAWSRDCSCPCAAFPASLLPHCLQHFYRFLGEGAEQPLHFFSSFLGNHLPFAE